jgi:hypothetical protein
LRCSNVRCVTTGAPIIASLPHFYDAAPEYQTGVIGLNPSKEKHEILMIFEPVSLSEVVCSHLERHFPPLSIQVNPEIVP